MSRSDDWRVIAAAIAQEPELVVTGHVIPDGDCIGSMVALYLGLAVLGKEVVAVIEDKLPETYRYLKGFNSIRRPEMVERWPATVIYLDCSDPERVGVKTLSCLKNCETVINIDHHPSNTFFGNLNRVEPGKASTAELVLELLDEMQVPIDQSIASAIYTGIIMDTGCFQYSNTRPETLRAAARMLDQGAQLDTIRNNLFESRPVVEVKLLQQALNTLSFASDGRIAWMVLTYEDIARLEAQDYHFEGLINYARFIEGVEVGLLFREIEPGVIKVGFRSKEKVDVNSIAARFGGGGHVRAAGARLEGDIADACHRVIEAVKEVVTDCRDVTGF